MFGGCIRRRFCREGCMDLSMELEDAAIWPAHFPAFLKKSFSGQSERAFRKSHNAPADQHMFMWNVYPGGCLAKRCLIKCMRRNFLRRRRFQRRFIRKDFWRRRFKKKIVFAIKMMNKTPAGFLLLLRKKTPWKKTAWQISTTEITPWSDFKSSPKRSNGLRIARL